MRQTHKMVKHTQAIRQLLLTNCLSMFDHFVGLVREGLISSSKNAIKKKKDYDSILPLLTNSNVIDLAWSKLQQALELVFNVYLSTHIMYISRFKDINYMSIHLIYLQSLITTYIGVPLSAIIYIHILAFYS